LFGEGGVKPLAATPGILNNTWFFGAAAALAEWPERIKRLFIDHDEYSPEGIFDVLLNVNGMNQHVVIDDRLPVDQEGDLVNARPINDSAWWMVLLEKAYAKLNVNYANLEHGSLTQVLR